MFTELSEHCSLFSSSIFESANFVMLISSSDLFIYSNFASYMYVKLLHVPQSLSPPIFTRLSTCQQNMF